MMHGTLWTYKNSSPSGMSHSSIVDTPHDAKTFCLPKWLFVSCPSFSLFYAHRILAFFREEICLFSPPLSFRASIYDVRRIFDPLTPSCPQNFNVCSEILTIFYSPPLWCVVAKEE